MSLQPVYHIQHIDLRSQMGFTSSGKQYFVFWWGEIPLGHF